jgi:DNA polymerase-3 subunit epsilon
MSVLHGPLVFVDVETTGMSYVRSRVIEVAALRVEDGQIKQSFTSLVDPGTELPAFITGLTGIARSDLKGAPSFYDIAEQLYEVLKDAVFVAHNVRFDYGFIKHEFRRTGKQFNPKQLCTVKLSKALYPAERGHKLQNLIDRCDIKVNARHRAYDDAHAMWQFIQHAQVNFPAPLVETAIKQQLRSPSIPKNLSPSLIKNLPEEPGVYIFEDDSGSPLYIGKSVNIKKRVLSHFSADHEIESEFKIAQQIQHIDTIVTNGELEALLLESELIKNRQPLFNRQLRRRQKLTLARKKTNSNGYITLSLEDTESIEPDNISDIMAAYTTKGRARDILNGIIKDFELCPKLMGFEKGPGSCFWYQLRKCRGACAGKETAQVYNKRLLIAFEGHQLEEWPYASPIVIEEASQREEVRSIIVDKWCVIANLQHTSDGYPTIKLKNKVFDLDTYKILRSYLKSKPHKLKIRPISIAQLEALAA